MLYTRLNKAPPVADRPRCPMCGRHLRPYWHTIKTERDERQTPGGTVYDWRATVEWRNDYHAHGGLFDTRNCAVEFAKLAHRAGYRRKTLPTTEGKQ